MFHMRALVLFLALALSAGAQSDEMVVITVRNRPAQDLVEVLQPLVGPGGSVTAMNDRLILRAAPGTMASLRKLVAELDVTPRSLLLTVRRAGNRSAQGSSAQAGGMVSGAGVSVTTSRSGTAVTTTSSSSRTVVTGSLGASAVDSTSDALQQVQVLEGQKAFIGTGVETPAVMTSYATIAGQSAVSGFFALPRVSGSLVTVEIWVSDDRPAPNGRVRTDRLSTTIAGQLGEWLSLGSMDRSATSSTNEPLAREHRETAQTSSLELRVEELR
jgi:hypothetical protein